MIRDYRPEDLEAVVHIAGAAWEKIYDMYHGLFGDELFTILFPDRRTDKGDQLRRQAAEHPDRIVVCEIDGEVVGFATWRLDATGKIGEIGNNAVAPQHAGKGIGRQMHAHVLDIFRRLGCRYARVWTGLDDAHAPARRAYEAGGFDIQERTVTYYRKL